MGIFRNCGSRIAGCESGRLPLATRNRFEPRLDEERTSPFTPHSAIRNPQSGFTLAGLLVILTVIAVITAYFVPEMWSTVMQRERDLQTVFVMKQYARAINEYQRVRGGLPTSLEQLEKQTMPRVLRKSYVNPQSGELDWVLVPQGTVTPGQQQPPGGRPGNQPPGTAQPPQGQGPGGPATPLGQPGGGDPRNYSGPFIGVRPPQTGESFLEFNGQKSYENWMYTVNELQAEQAARGMGQPKPPQGGGPGRN